MPVSALRRNRAPHTYPSSREEVRPSVLGGAGLIITEGILIARQG
jgi:hypothetical protein